MHLTIAHEHGISNSWRNLSMPLFRARLSPAESCEPDNSSKKGDPGVPEPHEVMQWEDEMLESQLPGAGRGTLYAMERNSIESS